MKAHSIAWLVVATVVAGCSPSPGAKEIDGEGSDAGHNQGGGKNFVPGVSCPNLGLLCDDVCTEVLTDPANCGACGVSCQGDQTCKAGFCVSPCDRRTLGADVRLVAEVAGNELNAAAVADLDGDEYRDYVLLRDADYRTSYGAGHVLLLEEQPNGTVAELTAFTTNSQPETILLQDFDGDGYLDLAVLGPEPHPSEDTSNKITTVLSAPNDTFTEVENRAPVRAMYGFATDVDADGDVDIVFTDEDAIWFARNDGDGAFSYDEFRPTGRSIRAMLGWNVDEDGADEAIVVSHANDAFAIEVFDLEDASAAPLTLIVDIDSTPHVALGDLDGDGRDELITTEEGMLRAYRISKSGTPSLLAETSLATTAIATGDLDGDTRDEIYADQVTFRLEGDELVPVGGMGGVYHSTSHRFVSEEFGVVLYSSSRSIDGPGAILEWTPDADGNSSHYLLGGAPTLGFRPARIDDDAHPDIVYWRKDRLGWASSKAGWAIVEEMNFAEIRAAQFRDVGDGVELYVWPRADDLEDAVVRFQFSSDGITSSTLQGKSAANAGVSSAFVDLDLDGFDEWINESGSLVLVSETGELEVGDIIAPERVQLATDFDGDGDVDVLGARGLRVWLASSSGYEVVESWQANQDLQGTSDLNGDGVGDFYGLESVHLGGPIPRAEQLDLRFTGQEHVMPYDFEGDGIEELITWTAASHESRVYHRAEDGQWSEASEGPLKPWRSRTSARADMNGDGVIDLLFGGSTGLLLLVGGCE